MMVRRRVRRFGGQQGHGRQRWRAIPFSTVIRPSENEAATSSNVALLSYKTIEFISIKPLVAMGSDAPERYATHSKSPSPDRVLPPSGGGWCHGRYGSA